MYKLLPGDSHLCCLSKKKKKIHPHSEFKDHMYMCILQYTFAYSPFEDHFVVVCLFYQLVLAISWALLFIKP